MNVELLIIIVGVWVVIDIVSRLRIASIANTKQKERYLDYFMLANIAALLVLFFYLYRTYMEVAATNG